MFPVTDKAKSVLDALLRKIGEHEHQALTETPVAHVRYENGQVAGVKLQSGELIDAQA